MQSKNHFALLILFICAFSFSYSQSISVKGRVINNADSTGLPGAAVELLQSPGSSLYKGIITDINGKFEITAVNTGEYILKISYIGFRDYFRSLNITNQAVNVGTISMKEKRNKLEEVEIVEKLPQATLKGDTTEFNAGAFKTNPDATAEDLIQKMPGITSQNGKVQAQGEDVKQVLVDGKPFFGDDPNAAIKNLPADVIDKIQVYDKLSDQAQFTGFDDGNSSKTINIITKVNMRNGTFGKMFAGYGYDSDALFKDDRYKAGGNINIFNGDRRFSILALSNNINQQNFTTEDLLGVMSGSGNGGQGRGGGGRGSGLQQRGGSGGGPRGGGYAGGGGQGNNAGTFLVNQSGGIATTNSVGINYSDKWAKKIDVTGGYFFNRSDNKSDQVLFRQYVIPSDSGLVYNESSYTPTTNINHRLNLRLDYQIDSSNSILIQPKLSVQMNSGSSTLTGINQIGNDPVSETRSNSSSDLTGTNFTSPFLFRHKFQKRGRTFSLNVNTGYNENKGNSYLLSANNFYADSLSASSDSLDQRTHLNKNGWSVAPNAIYTEPLSTKSIMQFNYGASYSDNKSDKGTYDYSVIAGDFTKQDSLLSNTFANTYQTQSFGTSYRMRDSALQFSIGASYQQAMLHSDQTFPFSQTINRNFTSFLPNAMLRFILAKKKSLNITYRASNTPPSVDQLQNVVNNTNPLQLTTGNPDLQQNYQHNLFIRYSAVNTAKSTTFFVLLSGTYADNYVTNSTIIAVRDTTALNNVFLSQGAQLTQPVNMNGYYTVRSFVVYGFPLNFKKSNLNLNFNANISYMRTPGLINNEINYTESPVGGAGISIGSNISPELDFLISTTSTENSTKNTLEKDLNSNYFNQNTMVKFNWIFLKEFVIQTDLSYQHNSGLSASFNQDYYLWNAALGYKFLAKRQADIRFSVADILNQNTNIQHNTTETYIEDVRTNVLQRYYMLTFTYNLKSFTKQGSGRGNK